MLSICRCGFEAATHALPAHLTYREAVSFNETISGRARQAPSDVGGLRALRCIESGAPVGYHSIRQATVGSDINRSIPSWCSRRSSSTILVEQFPRRIQMTFGGCPYNKLRW